MGAHEDLVAEGKMRYYGCSYFSGAQMRQAAHSVPACAVRWNLSSTQLAGIDAMFPR